MCSQGEFQTFAGDRFSKLSNSLSTPDNFELKKYFSKSIKNALALTPSVDMIYKKKKKFCKIVTRINPQKFWGMSKLEIEFWFWVVHHTNHRGKLDWFWITVCSSDL